MCRFSRLSSTTKPEHMVEQEGFEPPMSEDDWFTASETTVVQLLHGGTANQLGYLSHCSTVRDVLSSLFFKNLRGLCGVSPVSVLHHTTTSLSCQVA
jgi:hypothetical protein